MLTYQSVYRRDTAIIPDIVTQLLWSVFARQTPIQNYIPLHPLLFCAAPMNRAICILHQFFFHLSLFLATVRCTPPPPPHHHSACSSMGMVVFLLSQWRIHSPSKTTISLLPVMDSLSLKNHHFTSMLHSTHTPSYPLVQISHGNYSTENQV